MTSRRSNKDKRSVKQTSQQGKGWRRFLLLATLTPLAAGLLLIFGAVFDMIIWVSVPAQALLGGLFMLGSFVLFNVLQNQWLLALGWLLLGLALWLGLTWWETWLRGIAYLLGGAGVILLAKAFIERFQEQQRQVKKR